ncbi:MAG: M48 family metallopeptidase [Bauldia sp.]|nr:M48 family metallopeptidase [Bauldia sp.]
MRFRALLRKPDPSAMTVELLAGRVEVKVTRNPRARRYTLRLPQSGGPVLTLPARGSLREAEAFLNRHRGWLERRLKARPAVTSVGPGAIVPIRGVPHRVVHRPGPRVATRTGLEDGEAVLVVGGEAGHLARRVGDLLRREARRDLEAAVALHAGRLGVRAAAITLRDTRSRWGSCSSRRSLSFSWRLIMAPPEILSSLAAHEVAHIREMNHGPRFWRLVEELDPDWERSDQWLKRHGPALHAVLVV